MQKRHKFIKYLSILLISLLFITACSTNNEPNNPNNTNQTTDIQNDNELDKLIESYKSLKDEMTIQLETLDNLINSKDYEHLKEEKYY